MDELLKENCRENLVLVRYLGYPYCFVTFFSFVFFEQNSRKTVVEWYFNNYLDITSSILFSSFREHLKSSPYTYGCYYYSFKVQSFTVQFINIFPKMEAVRLWTEIPVRNEGLKIPHSKLQIPRIFKKLNEGLWKKLWERSLNLPFTGNHAANLIYFFHVCIVFLRLICLQITSKLRSEIISLW